ncbi:MAG TPA: hypothetical protein VJZ00_05675 [Thermoanaerobaculia bacterium]|nr:hypothetical protein [Thermoanaerobaculia bacterium]
MSRATSAFVACLALGLFCVACRPADIRAQPDYIKLYVGEETTMHVTRIGGYSSTWRMDFYTKTPSIAFAEGELLYPDREVDIRVAGRAPGATLVRVNGTDGIRDIALIEVVCEPESPITPLSQPPPVSLGQSVTLTVVSRSYATRVFTWYEGRTGDKSHPIAGASGPELVFKPERAGQQYVWVSADSVCASTTAEFALDVTPGRRRSVR